MSDACDSLACAVYFDTSFDTVVIGNSAKEFIETDGEKVVQFVKSRMASPNEEIFEYNGKKYSPTDISALIVRKLILIAQEQGHKVSDVVITVPYYFRNSRMAGYPVEVDGILRACKLAGVNVVGVLTDTAAAILTYIQGKYIPKKQQRVLVYDLGGATLDVSIAEINYQKNEDGNEVPEIKMITTSGNEELGGLCWDNILFDYILQACCDENGLASDEIDSETRQLIRSRVEITKKKLSSVNTAKVKICVNGVLTRIEITREELESRVKSIVDQTMEYVENTLRNVENSDIDCVLLVGGSVYIPMIKNAIEKRFPGKVHMESPELVIAKGAAIYGYLLNNKCMPEPTDDNNAVKRTRGATREILKLDELFEEDKQLDENECNVERDRENCNYYELLQLDFDPPEKNQRRIDKAIAEWKKRTEDMLANETIATRRAVLSAQLSLYTDMVECMRDLKTRNQEACALKDKRLKELISLLNIMPIRNNTESILPWEDVVDLSEQFRLSIQTISTVLEEQFITFEKRPYLPNLNDIFVSAVLIENIKEKLHILKEYSHNSGYQDAMNMYDFFDCYFTVDNMPYRSRERETFELEYLAKCELEKLATNVGAEGTICVSLFGVACQFIFNSEKNRQRYDNTLKIGQWDDLFSGISSAPMSFRRNPKYADKWIIEILKKIPDEDVAVALYNSKAKTGLKPYIPAWYVRSGNDK